MSVGAFIIMAEAPLVRAQQSPDEKPVMARETFETPARPMVSGATPATSQGWKIKSIFTVGETVYGYRPPGTLDGIGAIALDKYTVRVFVNHEFSAGDGYPYELANGTVLTGARISFFDVDRTSRRIAKAGLAYDKVIDAGGRNVSNPRQINEGTGNPNRDGLSFFCAGWLGLAGTFSLEDDVYFTGEERSNGRAYVLDIRNRALHVLPQLGRAAFEAICFVDTGDPRTIGALISDDRDSAPLILYIGQKDAIGMGTFLDRNGLERGDLYVWVADDGSKNPAEFNGTGESRTGKFKKIDAFSTASARANDTIHFKDQRHQDGAVARMNAFMFSRPEDIGVNPADHTEVVFAATGGGAKFAEDNWGTTYHMKLNFEGKTPTATVTILYDGDDEGGGKFALPDLGIRNPDNVEWASNGMIYIQEDRSTKPRDLFGNVSGVEASIWQLDPKTRDVVRVIEMDRRAIPRGQADELPEVIGTWETSGILDVTHLFETAPGELLLIADIQAHSLVGRPLGGERQKQELVRGGQLVFLSGRPGTTVRVRPSLYDE